MKRIALAVAVLASACTPSAARTPRIPDSKAWTVAVIAVSVFGTGLVISTGSHGPE